MDTRVCGFMGLWVCHISQHMTSVNTRAVAENICSHLTGVEKPVGDSGQATEQSIQHSVDTCPRFVKEATVAGRSGWHVQRESV